MRIEFRFLAIAFAFATAIGCGVDISDDPALAVQIDKKLVAELALMVEEDQRVQQIAIATRGDDERAHAFKIKDEVFKKNTARVREIFEQVGFPGFDLVGEDGSHNFWLIVQHADSKPEFQVKVLSEMEIQIGADNANKVDFAYLWDRVKKNANEPQRFGTQLTFTDQGQAVPFPIENSKNVNIRREEIGMASIEKYLNEMSESHFEMNKEIFLNKGITKYLLYAPNYSSQFLFESPKSVSEED